MEFDTVSRHDGRRHATEQKLLPRKMSEKKSREKNLLSRCENNDDALTHTEKSTQRSQHETDSKHTRAG